MNKTALPGYMLICALILLAGCSARIAGVVRLTDINSEPVTGITPEGAVVNMINTDAALDKASYSVILDKSGKFSSSGAALQKGRYKLEVSMPGYVTTTVDVELGKSSDKLVLDLKKIPVGSRSWRNRGSDDDKIVNPGEVNIQPPLM